MAGRYLCERVAVGPDEPTSKCHEFGEVVGGGLKAGRCHAPRGDSAAHVEKGASIRVVYGLKAGAFDCNHAVARGVAGWPILRVRAEPSEKMEIVSGGRFAGGAYCWLR